MSGLFASMVLSTFALATVGAPSRAAPAEKMESHPRKIESRTFITNCQFILFGEVLNQVPSDDHKSMGTLIECTEDSVLINGRAWFSTHAKRKQMIRSPQHEKYEELGRLVEDAARPFRAHCRKSDAYGRRLHVWPGRCGDVR